MNYVCSECHRPIGLMCDKIGQPISFMCPHTKQVAQVQVPVQRKRIAPHERV